MPAPDHHARTQAEAALRQILTLHTKRPGPIKAYDCWEGDCEHEDTCPVLARAVCAHCADQTEPKADWEHMIRPAAFWPCETLRLVEKAYGKRAERIASDLRVPPPAETPLDDVQAATLFVTGAALVGSTGSPE